MQIPHNIFHPIRLNFTMGKKDSKDAAKKEARALRQAKKLLKGEKKAGKEEAGEDGGEDDIEAILNELRIKEERKTAVTISVVDQPSPRQNFTLTALPSGDMLMFGGEFCDGAGTVVYNDVYRWNIDKAEWKRIESPNTPAPRCSHQAVYFNDKLYIFGGEYATLDQFHHYKDLWQLDLKTNTWMEIKATGDCPSARSGHRMCVWRGYMVLFGGFYEQKRECNWYCDTYIYSFQEESWSQVQHKPMAHIPRKRSGHQMVLHASEDCIFLYGGFSKEKMAVQDSSRKEAQVHDDMWMLDLRPVLGLISQKDDDGESAASGAAAVKKGKKDKEKPVEPVFDASKAVWSKVAKKGVAPSIRSGAVIVPYKSRALLFGGVFDEETAGHGMHSVFYSDMYSYDLAGGRWYEFGLNTNTTNTLNHTSDSVEKVSASIAGDELEVPDTVLTTLLPSLSVSAASTVSPADKSKMAEVGYVGRHFASKYSSTPCPRINPAVFIRGHRLYIYGGVTELEDIEIALDDCWSIDLNKRDAWKQELPGTMHRFAWKGPIETATEGSLSEDENEPGGEDGEEDDEDDEETTAVDQERETDDGRSTDDVKPLTGEALRDFYTRTSAHWLAAASASTAPLAASANEKEKAKHEKEVKRMAFSLAEEIYNAEK